MCIHTDIFTIEKQLFHIYLTGNNIFKNIYECGTCFRASYSKLGSELTLHTLETHILPYDLFLDNFKQLFGDIQFYFANMKCLHEPFIYFHGEVKGTLLTFPISVHGT